MATKQNKFVDPDDFNSILLIQLENIKSSSNEALKELEKDINRIGSIIEHIEALKSLIETIQQLEKNPNLNINSDEKAVKAFVLNVIKNTPLENILLIVE